MKKLIALFLSIILCFSCFAVSVSAADDGNDTIANATLITTGTSAILETQDDVDYYKFAATKDYFVVNFSVAPEYLGQDTKKGWNVSILDSNNNVLDSAVVTDSFTSIRLSVSGTIYIMVEAHDNYFSDNWPEGIGYTLSVAQTTNAYWESEYNDTDKTANTLALGKIYTAGLHKQGDIDWFKANVTKDYFTFSLAVNPAFAGADVKQGWTVTIYDKSLNELAIYNTTGGLTSERLAFNGTVYVKVEARDNYFSDNWPQDIEYKLAINQVTNALWESEYNDTFKTANSVSCNKTYVGSLYKQGDVDWYKAKVTKDYFTVSLGVNKADFAEDLKKGWEVEIYNSSLELLTSFTCTNSAKSCKLGFSGTIYVKVAALDTFFSDSWPNNILYNLKVSQTTDSYWENEGNDTLSKATTLKNEKSHKGNLYQSGDVDYYKFKVPASGTLKVKVSRDIVQNFSGGFMAEVIDKSGNTIKRMEISKDASATVSGIKVSKGTYYVVISPKYWGYPGAYVNYKVACTFKLSKPTLSKVTASKKAFKASWKKKSYVDGYQIQYATKSNFKKAKTVTVSKSSTTSKTIKKLSGGKKYYVRIRTYEKLNGKKIYSSWTKAKSVKTKKK